MYFCFVLLCEIQNEWSPKREVYIKMHKCWLTVVEKIDSFVLLKNRDKFCRAVLGIAFYGQHEDGLYLLKAAVATLYIGNHFEKYFCPKTNQGQIRVAINLQTGSCFLILLKNNSSYAPEQSTSLFVHSLI